MSFYLTLPSNVSFDIYSNNTQSNYTTQLKTPLELDDNYEVALTEFFCSSRIIVTVCKLEFIDPYNRKEKYNLNIEVSNRHKTTKELIEELNMKIKLLIRPKINGHFDDLIKNQRIPQFDFDDNTSELVLIYQSPDTLIIEGTMAYILFGKNKAITKSSVSANFQRLMSNITQYAAIYLDIIQDQMIGDITAPILQIVNLNPLNDSDHIHIFENPHYIPINKRLISTINIRILDLEGNQIKFSDIFSFTILKLHFRKIKNESNL